MAYNPMNPQMNPMNPHEKMSYEEMGEILNHVCSYLAEGEKWHSKTANELRKMPNKRGYARIHDDQAKCDAEKLLCLNKMLRDHMGHEAMIDIGMVQQAEAYKINSFEDFKNHFQVWLKREKDYLKCINDAIMAIRDKDMELYCKFCELAKDVKMEIMRSGWLHDSLADVNWDKHHCAVVSKWLHEQAEHEPGDWNWNIG